MYQSLRGFVGILEGPMKLQPRVVQKIVFFRAKISDFLVRE
jgi:hypothetical protein